MTDGENVNLPALPSGNSTALDQLTKALRVPREVLAADDEIGRVWAQLPRLIQQIPLERRSELHVRMAVAIYSGLFDAAINYAWNSSVVALRDKVRAFGVHVVPQLIDRDFDEQALVELTDAQLLDLCHSLNLISEDAFFFLNQSREVRNNFSTAHPPIGSVDDAEFIVFLTRCAKYALDDTANPRGVDTKALIGAVKGPRHDSDQRDEWIERIDASHEAQQDLIIAMLHGIYCDPGSNEETRLNALGICSGMTDRLTPNAKSDLINRHSDYLAEGEVERRERSQEFFEAIGLLSLLTAQERHSIVSSAVSDLMRVHQDLNNFYNEPPFAKRLAEIISHGIVPETAREELVRGVVTCRVGNPYGVSHAAVPYYDEMIRGFGTHEVEIVISLPRGRTHISQRLRKHKGCRSRFREVLTEIDEASVPKELLEKFRELRNWGINE